MEILTPISDGVINNLKVGDQIEISGVIYCGRDAVLPKLACVFDKEHSLTSLKLDLTGAVIFHTAVSKAGIGPTTSNKVEIEGSMPLLSQAGVKIHLGKGSLGTETIKALKENNSIFAITPPVTALFMGKMLSQQVVAFPEEGMEAFYQLKVNKIPAIVAIAHGKSIYEEGAAL